jgi:hypothetical protein
MQREEEKKQQMGRYTMYVFLVLPVKRIKMLWGCAIR